MNRQQFISLAGSVFEFGFKLGFAIEAERKSEGEWKEEWKKRKEHLLSLRLEGRLGEFSRVLKKISQGELYLPKILNKRDKSLLEILREEGINIDNNSKLHRLVALFVIGLYEGIFFVRYSLPKKGEIIPWIFEFGTERPDAGTYENADLIFRIEGKEIHVYELKLYGGAYHIIRMLTPYEEKEADIIPPLTRGMQLSITLGERNLEKFISSVYEIGKELLDKGEIYITPEIKFIIQLLSYSLDLLSRERKNLSEREIVMGLIYPTTDGPVFRFPIEEGIDYAFFSKMMKELYAQIKQIGNVETMKIAAEVSSFTMVKEITENLENIKKEIIREQEELWKRIREREEKKLVIIPESSISEIREKVRKDVEEFYKNNPWGRVLALLHSTGTGKTTSVVEFFLEKFNGKVVFLYIAPRIQLLKELREKVEKIKGVKLVWPYEKEEEEWDIRFIKMVDEGNPINSTEGKLKGAVNKASSYIVDGHEKIAIFLTTQSITRTPKTKETTFRHLKERLEDWIEEGYKIVIALDEITGARNGFLALEEALKLLKEETEQNTKTIRFSDWVTVLVFDASLHSKGVFEKIAREWEELGFTSPAFIFSNLEREGIVEVNGIPIEVKTGFSFPAKKLVIREKFLLEKSKKDLIDSVAKICIEEAKKQKEKRKGLFIYIQDRNAVMEIKNKIKAEGLKVLAITSNFRQRPQSLEDNDVVVSTSSLSRGVSLGAKFTKTIVITSHFFRPEEGAMEDLQATARMRGGNDETIEKEILRIYGVYTDYEASPQEISEIKRLILDDIVRTFLEVFLEEELEKEEYEEVESTLMEVFKEKVKRDYLREMLVYGDIILKLYESYYQPKGRIVSVIPAQSRTIYYPESLSKTSRLFSFLKELHDHISELSEEDKKLVWEFTEKLRGEAFVASPKVILSEGKKNIKDYYPPYLIVKSELKLSPYEDKVLELRNIYQKIKPIIKKENPEIIPEFDNLFIELVTGRKTYQIWYLIYIPALAIGYECIEENFKSTKLYFPKSITRHQVEVLGAPLGLYAQIRVNPHSNDLESVAFPISAYETTQWLKSPYPSIDGELLLNIIHKLTH